MRFKREALAAGTNVGITSLKPVCEAIRSTEEQIEKTTRLILSSHGGCFVRIKRNTNITQHTVLNKEGCYFY